MKRLLLAGAVALLLAGCGGSEAVGANSSESTEISAVGTIVANQVSPTPTPDASEAPAVENAATPDAAATNSAPVANETALDQQ